jgi:hypothetical protein
MPMACSNQKCCDGKGGDKMAQSALGSGQGKVAAGKPINSMCPIGGDEFNPEGHPAELTRVHQNTTIAFCCNHCVEKFDKMDAAGKDGVLALAKANKAK